MAFFWFDGAPISISGATVRAFRPKTLYPERLSHWSIVANRSVERYESLLDFCRRRKPSRIGLVRNYALGDILMLLPLARAIHRVVRPQHPVVVFCRKAYAQSLRCLGGPGAGVEIAGPLVHGCGGCDVLLELDECLQADHRGGPESDRHRIEIYGDAMGVDVRMSQ